MNWEDRNDGWFVSGFLRPVNHTGSSQDETEIRNATFPQAVGEVSVWLYSDLPRDLKERTFKSSLKKEAVFITYKKLHA